MSKFLNNINLEAGNDIQFKTTAGSNAGKIEQDGNNLVLSNAVGDVLLGDGSSDVYIGDGTNNVDILFEQSGSIKGDGSAVTLTIGGANTTLNLENPNINGALSIGSTSINNKLTFTSSSGYILFDYEPTTAGGEYTSEVPLLKVDRSGSELTVLSRLTNNGAISLGNDDAVAIVAGDTKSVIKDNWNYAAEIVILASEGGFYAYGFPSNDTAWSNRNEFRFRSDSGTASDNGLYIGDGSSTQFIDLSRNLKNIGTIGSGAITSSGSVTATSFIKSGGTTNQFLKANGNVDGTAYAPLANPTFTGTVTVGGILKDGEYHNAGSSSWKTKKYVRSVGVTGADIQGVWVYLARVVLDGSYEKARVKFNINSYDDVASGVEAIDVSYENGPSSQEHHILNWYSTDGNATTFSEVRSIRSSSSGLSNTYDLYVQMSGDWRDTFTVVAESWVSNGSSTPITFPTSAGSSTAPTAGSDDKAATSREWYTSNSQMYSGTNKFWHAGNDGSGSGLDADLLDGNHASAFAPAAGSTSILSLGTVVEGTWNAGVIASAYLDADTAHLSGAQTFSGAKTFSSGLNISVSTSNTQLKLKRTGTATGEFNIYTNNDTLFFNNVGQSSYPMVIDEDGNVGIGTTSPSYRLSVDDNSVTNIPKTLLQFDASSIADNGGYNIDFRTSSNDLANRYVARIRGIRESSGALSQLSFWTESGSALEQRMTIRASGNVGIGTSSPSGLLHVSSGTSGDAVVIIESDTDNNNEDDNPQLQFKQDGGATIAKAGLAGNAGTIFTNSLANAAYFGNDEAASLQLYTNATARLTIESGGNVGIGTTNPTEKLEVAPDSDVSAIIGRAHIGKAAPNDFATFSHVDHASSTNYALNQNQHGDTKLNYANGRSLSFRRTNVEIGGFNASADFFVDTDTLYVDSSTDRVGIGTTSPTNKLDIRQSTSGGSDVIGTGAITIGSDNPYWTFRGTATSLQDLAFDRNYSGTWYESMRIQRSTGNVGIGTASPSQKLTVEGNIELGTGGYIYGDTTTPNLRLSNAAGALLQYGTSSLQNGGSLQFVTASGTVFRVNSGGGGYFNGGNVGIGTTSPTAPLTFGKSVYGGTSSENFFRIKFKDNGGIQNDVGIGQSDVNSLEFNKCPAGIFSFNDGTNGEVMRINSNGNVGIGTSSPSEKLEVRGSIGIERSNGAATSTIDMEGNFIFNAANGYNYKFRHNGADLVHFDQDGSVGIGTTSPTDILTINETADNSGIRINGYDDESSSYLKIFVDSNGSSRIAQNTDGSSGYLILEAEDYLQLIAGSFVYTQNEFRIYDAGQLSIGNGADFKIKYDNSTDKLNIHSSTNNGITMDTSGNVGIGDTSPISKLHVQDGDIKTVQASGAFDGGTFAAHAYDVNGRYAKYLFGINDTTYQRGMIYERTSGRISIVNNTNTTGMNERLTVTTSGKVGIGTNNPTQFFEAFPDLNFSGVIGKAHLGYAGYSDYAAFSHFDQANTSGYALRQGSLGDTLLNAKSGQHIYFRKNNSTIGGFNSSDDFYVDTDSLYVDVSANRVGIGTTSPASELDVDGVTTSKGFRTNTSNTNYNLITRNSTSTTLYVQAAQSNSTQTIASFRYGSATANAGTETFRIRKDNVNVFGANFTVDGSITGNSKNFSIKHPTKEGKRLVHSCLEGPEIGVYFRGRSTSATIEMPDYWAGLVHLDSMTVELTAVGPNQDLYVEDIADNGDVTVESNTEAPLNYFYVIYGERKDIDKLEIEVEEIEEEVSFLA